jgi:hypothetical protein
MTMWAQEAFTKFSSNFPRTNCYYYSNCLTFHINTYEGKERDGKVRRSNIQRGKERRGEIEGKERVSGRGKRHRDGD